MIDETVDTAQAAVRVPARHPRNESQSDLSAPSSQGAFMT